MELAKALILMGCAIGAGIAMISGFGPGITYNESGLWFRIDHILHSDALHAVDAERVLRRHRRDSRSRINADSRHCLYVGLYARSARRVGACDCQNYWIFSHTHSFFA